MKLKTKLMNKMTTTSDGKKNVVSNKRRREFSLICWKASVEITIVTTYSRKVLKNNLALLEPSEAWIMSV